METGTNIPDFDVLIEIADFFDVDIREILEGERKVKATPNEKEDLLLIADYTNREKRNLSRVMRGIFLAGLLAMGIYLLLVSNCECVFLCNFLLGFITAVLLLGVLVTTKYMTKIRQFKLKMLKRWENK